MQSDFAESIGGVCGELSDGAQREVSGRVGIGPCIPAVLRLGRQVKASKIRPWRSTLTKFELDGKRATVTVVTPGMKDRKAVFVNERLKGWRLTSLVDVEPVARFVDR